MYASHLCSGEFALSSPFGGIFQDIPEIKDGRDVALTNTSCCLDSGLPEEYSQRSICLPVSLLMTVII